MVRLRQPHFFYSLMLHAILLSVLIVSFDFSSPPLVAENNPKNNVISAMVMDSSPPVVKKRIPLPAPLPVKPASTLDTLPKPPPVPPKPDVLPKPIAPLKPAVPLHAPLKLSAVKPLPPPPPEQAIAIPDKQKHLKEDFIQKQLLADLKKQTETKQKAQRQKSIESEFAQEMKALRAKSLEQQMAQEKKRLAGIQAAQMQGVVDKYKALILQSISQHWLVPHNADKTLSAQLLIRVAPGGMVLDVQVIKSSGDEALDRSARIAVFKASPLPVPSETNEFEPFRQFVLRVKPENILETDHSLS